MKKLMISTAICAGLAISPAMAWHTLTPTITNDVSFGDPHFTTILSVTLEDRGPSGTDPTPSSVLTWNMNDRTWLGPAGTAPKTTPVCSSSLTSPTCVFGPIPESGDCIRKLSIVIKGPSAIAPTTVVAPTLYNACTNVGITVKSYSWIWQKAVFQVIYN